MRTAELRELHELVGCAKVFEFNHCTVANTIDGSSWILERTQNFGDGVVFKNRDEALAAARAWEVENA